MKASKADELEELMREECTEEVCHPTASGNLKLIEFIRNHSFSWEVSLADAIDLIEYVTEESLVRPQGGIYG